MFPLHHPWQNRVIENALYLGVSQCLKFGSHAQNMLRVDRGAHRETQIYPQLYLYGNSEL
jgi:hypothetical protein